MSEPLKEAVTVVPVWPALGWRREGVEEGAELINDPNSPVACFIDNVNNDDSV